MSRGFLDEARHVVLPDGIASSGLPAVQRTCSEIGVEFDPWQVGTVRCIVSKDSVGLYAAEIVVLSIPRQVGKTFVVGAVVFADSIIHPGTTTVWTAHRFKVARETFNELRTLATSPALAPHIDPDDIYTAAGNESITFRNGSRIVFAARERGSIRGFTKVRRLILDEAQILTEAAMADLAPTQNQAVNPQIILMGTPPKPSDPGEVFSNLRTEALEGNSDGLLYIEFSADPKCDTDDLEAWKEANPSLHTRTPIKAIRRLRKLLPSDADFRREALGIWDDTSARAVIDMKHWATLTDTSPAKSTEVGLAIDVTPARSAGAVSFAGRQPDGRAHVAVIEHKLGTGWIVDLVVQRRKDRPDSPVMVDASSPAASLIPDLEKAGIDKDHGLIVVSGSEMARACGAFYDAATGTPEQDGVPAIPPTLTHFNQPALNIALAGAKKRPLNDAWAWARRGDIDISPLVSCTLALAALERAPKKKRSGKVW